MYITEYHRRVALLLDKEQSGYFSPEQIDDALDIASFNLFNKLNAVYGTDTSAIEALAVFKYEEWVTSDVNGLMRTTHPCIRLLAAHNKWMDGSRVVYIGVKIVNEDEIGARLSSQVRPVNMTHPVMMVDGKGQYRVYPEAVHTLKISYFKRPTKPHYAYSVVNKDIIHDAAHSTAPEWPDNLVDSVVIGSLGVLGINLDNQVLTQIGTLNWQQSIK